MNIFSRLVVAALCAGVGLLGASSNTIASDTQIETIRVGDLSGAKYLVRIPERLTRDKVIHQDSAELFAGIDRSLLQLREKIGLQITDLPMVEISWLQKGRTSRGDPESPLVEKAEREFNDDVLDGYRAYADKRSLPLDSFSAFKPLTGNEFNLYIPAKLRSTMLTYAQKSGASSSYTGRDRAISNESIEANRDTKLVPLGWSMNDDNRVRLGSLNTQMNTWPWRTITHFSYGGANSGCSGTLIGPRHIVTAAHCINASGTNNWFAFTVSSRRNGTAFQNQSAMPGCPNGNCPNIGSSYWYFTPNQWRQANVSNREQYDIGIIVIPNRLGDATGWMGYWYAPIGSLNTVNKYSRGYPSCAATSNGQARIDDPADPLKCPTCTTDLIVCSSNHLYGDAASCSIGNATNVDGDGYNRNFRMSCDASAAMSGSPLYFYGNGNVGGSGSVYYTAHDIQWTCGGLATSSSCANVSRADRLVRLTPQHASWIAFFRAQFP